MAELKSNAVLAKIRNELKKIQIEGGAENIIESIAVKYPGNTNFTEVNIADKQALIDLSTYKPDTQPLSDAVYYISGSADANGNWVGTHSGITQYKTGLIIFYHTPTANLENATLTLNNLQPISLYQYGTTLKANDCKANSILLLMYTDHVNKLNQNSGWIILDDDQPIQTESISNTEIDEILNQ